MSKSAPNSLSVFFHRRLLPALLWGLLFSCGFVEDISNFEELSISTYPGEYNQIIASGDTLTLQFSEPIETSTLDGSLTITSWRSRPNGSWVYTPTTAVFYPSDPWEPGIRYVLQVTGSLTTIDGRRHEQDLYLPFFSYNTQAPLRLLSVTPLDGQSLAVDGSLTFTFNQAVDYRVFEDFFTLSPLVPGTYIWNTGTPEEDFYNQVTFTPEEGFQALQIYNWTIQQGAPSLAGTQVWESITGLFITQEETVPPAVVDDPATAGRIDGIRRMFQDDMSFSPPPPGTESLDFLRNGDAVFVDFTVDMDWSRGTDVIIFTPSIDGEILVYDDRTLVFLPSETWKDQEYTLEVSQEVRSLLGLEMDGVVSQTFTPDIRYQGFELTISLDTYDWESWPSLSTAQPLPLSDDGQGNDIPTGEVSLVLSFDDPYSVVDAGGVPLPSQPGYYQGRDQIAGAVQFESYFPSSVSSPQLVATSWSADYKTLTLNYQGLTFSTADEPAYYRLRISSQGTNVLSGLDTALDKEYEVILEAGL
jgi:hypothetical protein